ncbi:MAG: hypothetical protein Q8S73_27200 [Deltaproteobacteria bacterium]|nr:hypothetical protein [Myxococcales bacterium]MDP3217824.1 hypothetical protein [Deltaproteobacteria bacterium]
MTITVTDFEKDSQGRTYTDVLSNPVFRAALDEALTFMQQPLVLQRMFDAELHHGRPALAGAVKELERQPAFLRAVQGRTREETPIRRLKMCFGVCCRLVMEAQTWRKTASDGSLAGVGDWFTRARHYAPPSP